MSVACILQQKERGNALTKPHCHTILCWPTRTHLHTTAAAAEAATTTTTTTTPALQATESS
jgi:hypothetical protein